jgi:hypothetical protein
MKRLTMLALLLAFRVGFNAGLVWGVPGEAYVGLFADENHSTTSVFYSPGPPLPFTTWVWFVPGTRGVSAAELHLDFPSNVIVGDVTCNPPFVGCYGPPDDIVFGRCLTDWEWGIKVECVLTDSKLTSIELRPHAGNTSVLVATCELGNPLEPAIVLTRLDLNWEEAAEPVSWGAIKSLYR